MQPITFLKKKQQVPHAFHHFLGASSAEVTHVPVARLVSMLDCEHGEGSHYAVVSKDSQGPKNATVVLDVPLRRFFRAEHETGMRAFWKGVAKRHPGVVQYVDARETFRLPEPVVPNERDEEVE